MEWNRMPEELLSQIFLRLPVVNVLRCKSICKDWYRLIKSPRFIKQRLSCSQDCVLFQFRVDAPEDKCSFDGDKFSYRLYKGDGIDSLVEVSLPEIPTVEVSLPEIPTDRRAKILMGAENGIFCMVNDVDCRSPIFLYNAATREYMELPTHRLVNTMKGKPIVGFGFEPSTEDFKVVVFKRDIGKNVVVYSLNVDSWIDIEKLVSALESISPDYEMNSYVVKKVVLNGVDHSLIVFEERCYYLDILSFDMRTERFIVLPLPDGITNSRRNIRYTEFGDTIAVMTYRHDEPIDLWVMERDGGVFCKSFSVR